MSIGWISLETFDTDVPEKKEAIPTAVHGHGGDMDF